MNKPIFHKTEALDWSIILSKTAILILFPSESFGSVSILGHREGFFVTFWGFLIVQETSVYSSK